MFVYDAPEAPSALAFFAEPEDPAPRRAFAVRSSSPKLQNGTPPDWLAAAQAAKCPAGSFYFDKDGSCLSDEVTARVADEGVYTTTQCAALAIDDGQGGVALEYRCWSDGPKQETLVEATRYTPGIGSDEETPVVGSEDDEYVPPQHDATTTTDKPDAAAASGGFPWGMALAGAALIGLGILAFRSMAPMRASNPLGADPYDDPLFESYHDGFFSAYTRPMSALLEEYFVRRWHELRDRLPTNLDERRSKLWMRHAGWSAGSALSRKGGYGPGDKTARRLSCMTSRDASIERDLEKRAELREELVEELSGMYSLLGRTGNQPKVSENIEAFLWVFDGNQAVDLAEVLGLGVSTITMRKLAAVKYLSEKRPDLREYLGNLGHLNRRKTAMEMSRKTPVCQGRIKPVFIPNPGGV